MAAELILHELPPSPNNMKARIALTFKGLPYARRPLAMDGPPPFDRTALVALSSQPLTPVLQHGDVVVWDSHAIVRYLEGNFHDTPRLFVHDYATMQELERWELFARAELGQPLRIAFAQALAPEPDVDEARRATELLHEVTARVEQRLSTSPWLVGEAMTAADVFAAPFVHYATLTEGEVPDAGPVRFIHDHLKLRDDRDRTRDWVRRVMSYDR